MWQFKKKRYKSYYDIQSVVMTTFRDKIIMADNDKRLIYEISFDDYTGQYIFKEISSF